MSNPESKAKELLVYYFELASQGKSIDSRDCKSEIESIVDCILDAIEERKPETRISRLEQQVATWKRWHKEQKEVMRKALTHLERVPTPKDQVTAVDLAAEILSEALNVGD